MYWWSCQPLYAKAVNVTAWGNRIMPQDIEQDVKTSKYLSLVLRHKPSAAFIELDPEGWVGVDALIAGSANAGRTISRASLARIVQNDDKGRYDLDQHRNRIRANQGHSIPVELDLRPAEPPFTLYHGTTERFITAIRRDGLLKMKRNYVHLSNAIEVASNVGARRGKSTILYVHAGKMSREGYEFFLSANGVWLTDHVPPQYIQCLGIPQFAFGNVEGVQGT